MMRLIFTSVFSRFPICVLLFFSPAAVLVGTASAQPEVWFANSQYLVIEQSTYAPIALVLSEPATEEIEVIVESLETGTATCGADFGCGTGVATFGVGDQAAIAYVTIYSDTVPEDPETIPLRINDNEGTYLIGEPGTATLVIVDDDSDVPQAHFEVDEDIPPNASGHIALTVTPGQFVGIDVVVDDLPPGGATINYTSSADGSLHEVTFTDDPRQLIYEAAPVIPEGANHAAVVLTILNPPEMKSTSGTTVSIVTLPHEEWEFDQHCVLCMIAYIRIAMDYAECDDFEYECGFDCRGLKNAEDHRDASQSAMMPLDLAGDLEILSRYRDETLQGSPTGSYYIELYEDHSPGIVAAILQRPTLIHRVATVWELWLPAVSAQVDGQGGDFEISSDMETALLGVMAEFEEVGSSDLAELVADFRTELDLENIAGTTVDDLQADIESNPMPTERSSLSGVRSLFRGE